MQLQCSEISDRLESWFARPRGQYLLQQEQLLAETLLEQAFGYHQVQLGITGNQTLTINSRLGHSVYGCATPGRGVGLLTAPDCLPLANDSVDAVVLHHALEFSESPHGLLREAHRVLAPQGNLLIIGFNPASLLGAATRILGLFPDTLWRNCHNITTYRLKDWLNLLGAELQTVQHCFLVPPAGGERSFRLLSSWDSLAMRYRVPLGGVYAVHARKSVSTLTPTRIRWRRAMSPRLIGLSVPKPVASPCEGEVAA